MLNILIPLGSVSKFFEGAAYPYPMSLIEISGVPMIQHVIDNFLKINGEKRFIFILREEDCTRYHLDSAIRLLAGEETVIIKVQRETKGAVCSALLAIDLISNDSPLIIANGDQLFGVDLNDYIARFRAERVDAGCLCFESVHPRWSFVRLEGDDIVETAEKRPISKKAIAGFFYFTRGSDFVEAAFRMICKDASLNGQFFVALVLNELVLDNRRLRAYTIPAESFHTFYSPQKIEEYEQKGLKC